MRSYFKICIVITFIIPFTIEMTTYSWKTASIIYNMCRKVTRNSKNLLESNILVTITTFSNDKTLA